MKISKKKVPIKSKKTSASGEDSKSKKVTAGKSEPGEEEIRIKAREIYFERISRGESGTAEDDWREAEELLREP